MKKDNAEKTARKKHCGWFWLILLVITVALATCSAGVFAGFVDYGMYDSTKLFEKNIQERELQSYAVYALEDYKDDFRYEQLKDGNFRYAVYTTDDPSSVNLRDRSSYLVCTLTDEDLSGNVNDLYRYSATLGDYSVFSYNIDSLWNNYSYINNYGAYDANRQTETLSISDVVYVWNTDTIYIIFGDHYLPITAYFADDVETEKTVAELVNSSKDGWGPDSMGIDIILSWSGQEIIYDLRSVKVWSQLNMVGFAPCDDLLSWDVDLHNWRVIIENYPVEDAVYGQDYYLIAKVKTPLDTSRDDLFTRMAPLIDTAIQFRYAPIIAMAVFGILALIFLVKWLGCFFGWIKRVWKVLSVQWHGRVGLFWRAIFICTVCTLAEVTVLGMTYNEGNDELIILGWFFQTIVLVPLFILCVLQLRRLAEGAKRMSSGDLSAPIDTSHMFYDFKTIGNSMNTARDGLDKAVEARMKSERFKTELISNVSHDIKTPLTSIISYVELLKEQPVNEPANREYLETLDRQAVKLKKLLEDLIEASKASTGNLKADLNVYNVNTILHQVIGEYEEKLASSQIDLRIRIPDEQIDIMADPQHLQRVFDNLLTNISKYAQPGTRAYINLNAGTDNVVIEMKNTSREPLNMTSDELLERFARGDSSRGSEGNGLGLSIAQSLVELMNGKLRLDIDGDLFKILLIFPRVKSAEIQP